MRTNMRYLAFLTLVISFIFMYVSACKKETLTDKENEKDSTVQLSGDKAILSFKLPYQLGNEVITDSTVEVTVTYNAPKKLVPTITISEGATIEPASGTEVDFSKGEYTFKVTAADSSVKLWRVIIKRQPKIKGTILTADLPGYTTTTVIGKSYVIISVSGNVDYKNLAPVFTTNEFVTSEPASGTSRDFSLGYADYTLLSADSSRTVWRIYVVGQKFEADDNRILYTGRLDNTDAKAPKFSAPGVYITAKFKGTTLDIELVDEYKWGSYRNYFQVIIDNGQPQRFRTEANRTIYRIANNLSNTTHTVRIIKDTEAGIGYLIFKGFYADELLPADPLPERKIELFGNSITCGFGIYTDMCDKAVDNEWYIANAAALSYGAITAHNLNAQYHLTSVSGIGLIHSCCDMTYTMPDVYDKIFIDNPASKAWDFNKYIPDVVTICLGQNDGIQDSTQFTQAYIHFIDNLKSHYPQAHFFCLTSPMADNNLFEFQKKILTAIENYYKNLGDDRVHKVFLSHNLLSGCASHPDKNQHQMIAEELTQAIRDVMNW
ncbi:MAG TPA: SGNH/GDSL hydrolase family protein [Bacteroidales bacterium]|nr:SGNH/GDSL hydrolase family protein [Bacteroidales bacterium]HPO65395.1 SGNH/GDSL hydrolase family protein [Bacteroidales bacterium]